jgi:group I intron endonuclease
LIVNNGCCSVYVHINKINGKIYVGRTSQNPESRYGANGIGYLRQDKYSDKYLQPLFANAINKYGWENFDHEVIASNLTEEESRNFEKLLINLLHTNQKEFGYNMTDGGEDLSNLWTDERKKDT